MKKLPPLALVNCLSCDKPRARSRGEGVARYLNRKTHRGLCQQQYLKKAKIGWYSDNKMKKWNSTEKTTNNPIG